MRADTIGVFIMALAAFLLLDHLIRSKFRPGVALTWMMVALVGVVVFLYGRGLL